MDTNNISRGMGFASAAMAWLAAAGFAQPAKAQDWHQDFYGYCWIDVATKEVQPFGPPGGVHVVGAKKASYEGHNYALVPCPAQSRATTGLHPFFAVEGGGGWSNSTFDTMPGFSVGGSGFTAGVNGGALFDLSDTYSLGGRVGWQGGNVIGTVSSPPASPLFDYTVKTRSIFYEEVMFERHGWGIPTKAQLDMWASAGVAEVQTNFTGTSGAFLVTDSVNQTGFTGTLGVGVPVGSSFLGGKLEFYGQYRAVLLPATSINIPGRVQIDNQWIQSVNLGLLLRAF